MSKLPFDQERRTRAIKRKLLDAAFVKAAEGDVRPLVMRLRAGSAITEQRHLDAIADLITPPPKRGRGRPKGRDPSARAEALRTIVAMVRRRERNWHKRNLHRSFRGVRRKLIDQVLAAIEMEGDDNTSYDREFDFSNPITAEEVHQALDRGGSSQKIQN